ncbi:nucleotidyltransferase [Mycoplasma sp. Ms02]|uniref:nucleotidyltransferase n=1 Tax=Mycoplasma sp. Ms02 TaxID=353851 RepID=UPI00351D2DB0
MKKLKVGIIAEYNPFHNGHLYQIEQIKKKYPNSEIYVALSSDYTQRGEIAILSYRKRKKLALSHGVKKVFKIPFLYSAQAAHIFADYSVKLLYKKAKIDVLCFGSETNDSELFFMIAKTIKNNQVEYNSLIKKYLKNGGNSFPKAANLALQELTGQNIALPNDILGIEYVKTIVNNDLPIDVMTIARTVGFHSEFTNNQFASATLIRAMVKEGKDVSSYTPAVFDKIPKQIESYYPKFQRIVRKKSTDTLKGYKMITEGMENLFKKNIDLPDYETFVSECTSRRYTSSRIKRTMLFVLLKIKK